MGLDLGPSWIEVAFARVAPEVEPLTTHVAAEETLTLAPVAPGLAEPAKPPAAAEPVAEHTADEHHIPSADCPPAVAVESDTHIGAAEFHVWD